MPFHSLMLKGRLLLRDLKKQFQLIPSLSAAITFAHRLIYMFFNEVENAMHFNSD